jgi:hypothetical protein
MPKRVDDWNKYGRCPQCNAAPGDACQDQRGFGRGDRLYAHPRRPKRTARRR